MCPDSRKDFVLVEALEHSSYKNRGTMSPMRIRHFGILIYSWSLVRLVNGSLPRSDWSIRSWACKLRTGPRDVVVRLRPSLARGGQLVFPPQHYCLGEGVICWKRPELRTGWTYSQNLALSWLSNVC